jgi:hypothetical protein
VDFGSLPDNAITDEEMKRKSEIRIRQKQFRAGEPLLRASNRRDFFGNTRPSSLVSRSLRTEMRRRRRLSGELVMPPMHERSAAASVDDSLRARANPVLMESGFALFLVA